MKRFVIISIAVLCIFVVAAQAHAQGWWGPSQQQGYQPNPYLQQQQEMNRQLDQLNRQLQQQRSNDATNRLNQQSQDIMNRYGTQPISPYGNRYDTDSDSGSRGNTYDFGW